MTFNVLPPLRGVTPLPGREVDEGPEVMLQVGKIPCAYGYATVTLSIRRTCASLEN